MKKQLCAVALLTTTALTATAQADDFTYLSGGLLYNKQGLLAERNKANEENTTIPKIAKEYVKQKTNSFGYYLNGSVGFDNQVFVEGRIHHSRLLHQTLLGVGYHYPIMQQVDLYGLVGVSQRTIALRENFPEKILDDSGKMTGSKHHQEVVKNYSDSLRPTIEVGLKTQFNELAGVRVAYRFAQFGDSDKIELGLTDKKSNAFKFSKTLHEGRIDGYYKLSDNLAAEAGYTYTMSLKDKSITKGKMLKDHIGTIGLRYTF
jgi:opacity protein-like surface antigen